MRYRLIPITILVFFSISCKQQVQKKDTLSMRYATHAPHDTEELGENTLSSSDKMKLADASGKKASIISADSLARMMQKADEGVLNLYFFWSLSNEASMKQLSALKQLNDKVGYENLNITYVSIDNETLLNQTNTVIREKGLASTTLLLSNNRPSGWEMYFNDWNGKVPALWLVNRNEDISLLYQQSFSQEELIALIQPFITIL